MQSVFVHLKSNCIVLITDTGISSWVLKLSRPIVLFSSTNIFRKHPVYREDKSIIQVFNFKVSEYTFPQDKSVNNIIN